MRPVYKTLTALFLVLICGRAYTQSSTYSPYSLFGAGLYHYDGFADNTALGRNAASYRFESNYHFNNPASLSALKHSAFNTGANLDFVTMSTPSTSKSYLLGGFNYISLGVPVKKLRSGMAAGLLPYSDIGYNIVNVKDSSGISVRNEFEGSGGLSKFNLSIGTLAWKYISLGVTYSYIFGQTEEVARRRYPGNRFMTSFSDNNKVYLKGHRLEYGLQLHTASDSGISHVLGITFSQSGNLSGEQDRFGYTYTEVFSGSEFVRDTMIDNKGTAVKSVIPGSFSVSYSIGNHEKWQFNAGMTQTFWSQYKDIYNSSNGFRDDKQYSAGFFICPKPVYDKTVKNNKALNYLKSIRYSVGYRQNSGYFQAGGQWVSETGLSAGLGFPFTQVHKKLDGTRVTITSRLFLTGEYIRRGSGSNAVLKEDYFRITLGLNLSDSWFNKRLFD